MALYTSFFLLVRQFGRVEWDVTFVCHFNDWEMPMVFSFLDFLYSHSPSTTREDVLRWKLKWSGLFDIQSFYRALWGWCCMRGCDGETVDHLMLHCPLADVLWYLSFGPLLFTGWYWGVLWICYLGGETGLGNTLRMFGMLSPRA